MSAIARLESALCTATGRSHALATGRGATAIWIALEALAERAPDRGKVILPATLCTSPPAVTRLAGLEPVFCDVVPESGNLDPVALADLLATHRDTLGVIAAHLYGQPCEIGTIALLCRTAGVALIEDAAQAWGADIEGRPAGSFGDVSIVSFGHTKIIDAGGGGAALSDDPDLAARLHALAEDLPEKPAETAQWAGQYRERYYALQREFDTRPEARGEVGALCLEHPGLYRYRLEKAQAARILDGLKEGEAQISRRREMATLYSQSLGPHARPLSSSPGGVPWRFSLALDAQVRDRVVAALREAGFDASCWYPCVADFFAETTDQDWPGARELERRVVNLWTDHSANRDTVRRVSTFINEVLAQFGSSQERKVAP